MAENIKSVTKNRQTEENLIKMVKKAFGEQVNITEYKELTEGCCNVAYKMKLSNGIKTILKIAPNTNVTLMSCEKELMKTEVTAMKLATEKNLVRVAKVYAYDDSCTICNGKYFFMEVIDGDSFYNLRDSIKEEEKALIRKQTGEALKQINSVKNKKFGHFCLESLQYDIWFDAFYSMVAAICEDGKKANVDVGVPYNEILKKLKTEQDLFEEVKEASFLHYDSWNGNIFVKDNHITGIIDWERAMWADPLMEDQFRKHEVNEDFLQGYGINQLTDKEKRRCLWYDVYLYLIMMIEGTYRNYETNEQYIWVKGLFLPIWEELSK